MSAKIIDGKKVAELIFLAITIILSTIVFRNWDYLIELVFTF
jgi:hypothetical protein